MALRFCFHPCYQTCESGSSPRAVFTLLQKASALGGVSPRCAPAEAAMLHSHGGEGEAAPASLTPAKRPFPLGQQHLPGDIWRPGALRESAHNRLARALRAGRRTATCAPRLPPTSAGQGGEEEGEEKEEGVGERRRGSPGCPQPICQQGRRGGSPAPLPPPGRWRAGPSRLPSQRPRTGKAFSPPTEAGPAARLPSTAQAAAAPPPPPLLPSAPRLPVRSACPRSGPSPPGARRPQPLSSRCTPHTPPEKPGPGPSPGPSPSPVPGRPAPALRAAS